MTNRIQERCQSKIIFKSSQISFHSGSPGKDGNGAFAQGNALRKQHACSRVISVHGARRTSCMVLVFACTGSVGHALFCRCVLLLVRLDKFWGS